MRLHRIGSLRSSHAEGRAQLASLRHVRLFASRHAAVVGSLYGQGTSKFKNNSKINDNSYSKDTTASLQPTTTPKPDPRQGTARRPVASCTP